MPGNFRLGSPASGVRNAGLQTFFDVGSEDTLMWFSADRLASELFDLAFPWIEESPAVTSGYCPDAAVLESGSALSGQAMRRC
jgi:hypothetical protein